MFPVKEPREVLTERFVMEDPSKLKDWKEITQFDKVKNHKLPSWGVVTKQYMEFSVDKPEVT